MSLGSQAERERAKVSAVADLLIGTPPDPSFIYFRERGSLYREHAIDPCPVVVLWGELSDNNDAINQITILLERELILTNDASIKKGNEPIDLLVGVNHGWRITQPLRRTTGLEYVKSERNGSLLIPRYPRTNHGVLIEDFAAKPEGLETVRANLRSREKPIEVNSGVIVTVAHDYPAVLRSFNYRQLPLRYLTSISAIAASPLMERFPPQQVKDLRTWDDRQKTRKG